MAWQALGQKHGRLPVIEEIKCLARIGGKGWLARDMVDIDAEILQLSADPLPFSF